MSLRDRSRDFLPRKRASGDRGVEMFGLHKEIEIQSSSTHKHQPERLVIGLKVFYQVMGTSAQSGEECQKL